MYLSRLPGYGHFMMLSFLIIILLGTVLNSVMYFSQFIYQASDQFGYNVSLAMHYPIHENVIKKQLEKCPHVKGFTIYKIQKNTVKIYLNVESDPCLFQEDVKNLKDLELQTMEKIAPIRETFVNFMRIFLVVIVIFLIILLLALTKYFLFYNRETLRTMFFLGCSKSSLIEKLESQFLKYYLWGIFLGIFSLCLKDLMLHFNEPSFTVFLIDYIQDTVHLMTLTIIPGIVLIVSVVSSSSMVRHQIAKL